MNKDIDRLKLNKRQIEKNILEAIETLERDFDVSVSDIQLQKTFTIGSKEGRTSKVVIEVKI